LPSHTFQRKVTGPPSPDSVGERPAAGDRPKPEGAETAGSCSSTCTLNYYAAVIADTGDQGRAIGVYRDAPRLAREVRQPDDEAVALQGLGEARLRQGTSF
jgi:hypothetical protein